MSDSSQIIDDPIEVRRNKRQAIIDAGGQAYAQRFDVDAHSTELEEKYAKLEDGEQTEDVVNVAGRIVAFRGQGKVIFIVIRDAKGDLQLFVRINNVGEDEFAEIKREIKEDTLYVDCFVKITAELQNNKRKTKAIK